MSWRGGFLLTISVLTLLAAGATTLFLRGERGRFLVAERFSHDDDRATDAIKSAIAAALTELRVADADRKTDTRPTGVRYTMIAQLPQRTWPVEANVVLTQRLQRLGATVWDAIEMKQDGAPAVRLTCGTVNDPLASVILVAPAATPDAEATVRGRGQLALILTDVDWTTIAQAERFARRMRGVAAAIVPGEKKSGDLAERMSRAGAELLALVPMEPKGYPAVDPGPSPVLVDMKPDAVKNRTRAAVRRIRGATGIANRMGSLAMQDLGVMRTVMSVLADEHLYFLELRSSPDAVTRRVGREIGVPVIPVDATLDARRRTEAQVSDAVTSLLDRAQRTGRAVATVHADSLTCARVLRALEEAHARLTPPSATL